MDSGLVGSSCNEALFVRIFVLCYLGIQYNNGISLSLSEDNIPCDESISHLEKLTDVQWDSALVKMPARE